MATATPQRQETLLRHLMRERHMTRERTVVALDRRAAEMRVADYALTVRQLDRWLAGQIETLPRPSVCMVVEAEFDAPIEELLAPREHSDQPRQSSSPHQSVSGETELRTESLVAWLADHSSASFEDLWVAVTEAANQLAAAPRRDQAAHQHRRDAVPRGDIADAVASYYRQTDGLYRVRVGNVDLDLTILTRPEWTGLGVELGGTAEDAGLAAATTLEPPHLEGIGLEAAIARVAEVEVNDTTLVNNDLYALADVHVEHDRLTARFALTDFASYALTADLLEEEIVDRLAGHTSKSSLRDLYLPDTDAALRFGSRSCVLVDPRACSRSPGPRVTTRCWFRSAPARSSTCPESSP